MALSFANVERLTRGGGTVDLVYAEITGDSAYAIGGETINATDLGLSYIKTMWVTRSTSGFFGAQYKRTNDQGGTLIVYVTGDPSTNSAAVPLESSIRDLSSEVFYVLALGR